MKADENLKQKNFPTLLQLNYLVELERLGTERGFVSLIAEKCGVNHGSVSRYLKSCIDNNYLSEDYNFTELGRGWLNGYKKVMEKLPYYLRGIGIPEQEIENNVKTLIENTELHTLASMIQTYEEMKVAYTPKREKGISENFKDELRRYGNCRIHYKFYQMERGEDARRKYFSMANRGFDRKAYLRLEDDGEYLILKICGMIASSRVDGKQKAGHLETLKYEREGFLEFACFDKQKGEVRIPMTACRFHRGQGGELAGTVPITVTCSVGRTHMPESTALLVFWI